MRNFVPAVSINRRLTVVRYDKIAGAVTLPRASYREEIKTHRHANGAHFSLRHNALDDRTVILKIICLDRVFDPVRDYLDGLRWDGVPRLDTWLIKYGGADDTPLNRAIGRKMLVAAVRRVRVPGCKFDYIVVLESEEQGIGKSTMLRLLAGDENFSDAEIIGQDKQQPTISSPKSSPSRSNASTTTTSNASPLPCVNSDGPSTLTPCGSAKRSSAVTPNPLWRRKRPR
jgi:hypothetical protein